MTNKQRGKFSFIVKNHLSSYKRWLNWIKGVVSYATVKKFDKYLDKWNGNLSDGLTLVIAKTTLMNIGTARTIANALIFLLFRMGF